MDRKKIYAAMLNQPIAGIHHEAHVYFHPEYDEYCVDFFQNGVEQVPQAYYSNGLGDAVKTARKVLFDIGQQQAAVCTVYGDVVS
jgi:hypothetical protein